MLGFRSTILIEMWLNESGVFLDFSPKSVDRDDGYQQADQVTMRNALSNRDQRRAVGSG
jgi:hypothetical protein